MDDDALFTLDEVTLRHGDTVVLDDVTMRFPDAAVTGLVGPSGAGKSSLLRLLVRLDDPDHGTVRFHGRPVAADDVLDLRRRVQLAPQRAELLTGRVLDELRVGRPDLTDQDATALLDRVGLPADFGERETRGLSGGEAQRVCLARSLALDPEVLLLDEPTSSLDEESAAAIETVIRDHVAADGAAVLVSHDSAQVRRVAHHVLTIDRGRIGSSAPEAS